MRFSLKNSLYNWLVSALFFWSFLACLESTIAIILNGFPPPLGSGSLPSAIDVRFFVGALSIYSLLSIPTALILFGAEGVFYWLKSKTNAQFLHINQMDLYLLFGWGLLFFKWISNLISYLTVAKHLPKTPYLVLIPLLGLYIWLSRFVKKDGGATYKVQWILIIAGTVFVSKTAYEMFISSSFSMVSRVSMFLLLAIGTVVIALLFYWLLNLILLNMIRPKPFYLVIMPVCMFASLLFTFNSFQKRKHLISYQQNHVKPKKQIGPAKNVIIILVDCLRADHLGCYGYTRKTSPFIDDIARSGIIFENCISPSSWTVPSVASLFTGLYPQQHGINKSGIIIIESLTTLQEVLEEQAVTTAAFVTNNFLNSKFGYAKGFHYYFDYYCQPVFKEYLASRLFFFNALLYFKNEIFNPRLVQHHRYWSLGVPPFNLKGMLTSEMVTDDVLEWIQINRDKPFYIYIHYMDLHGPYDVMGSPVFDNKTYPTQSRKEKTINVYDGRIVYVDKQIHRIWEYLNQLNMSEKTLLIITADHGNEFYDHKGRGHGHTLYEELIRVPLIVVNPYLPKIGQRVEKQVSLIDIPTTVLDFINLKPPEQMKGESLLTLSTDSLHGLEPSYDLSYTKSGKRRLRTKAGRSRIRRVILESLRVDNKWKIIVGSDGKTELYNLKKDKKEQKDLSDIKPFMVEVLKKKLAEESSKLKSLAPKKEEHKLSPDVKNKLRALGYL